MPRLDLQKPRKVVSAVTGMLIFGTVASLTCLALLLIGVAEGGVVESSILPFAAGPHGWRREALPWLLFGLSAFGGMVVLGGIALCRARQEDVAQRRMMEAAEALGVMLEEKDALLAEVHHRVKNNMQVVVSLLQLEAARLGDEHMRQRLDALSRRIALIGQVHERVYAAESFARMDASAHLAQHCAELAEEWPAAVLTTEAETLLCGLDAALPVAMIGHELVANALRHAAGAIPEQGPRVEVSLRRYGGEVLLRVKDDGVGPADEARQGMGLTLVTLLAEQVGAEVDARAQPGGYAVEVRLPDGLFR